MKLIVGLGNPDTKYDGTKHNTGFAVIDELAKRLDVKVNQRKKKAKIAPVDIEGEKVLLVKPQTYMNLSGESVSALAQYYGVAPADILIIVDDVALEPGLIRLRKSGSAGGHNGLKNINARLGTEEYPRLRVGVGEPRGDLAGYVLSRFDARTQAIMNETYPLAADAAQDWVSHGTEFCMNKYNKKNTKSDES